MILIGRIRVPEIDLVKKGLDLFFKLRKEDQDEF